MVVKESHEMMPDFKAVRGGSGTILSVMDIIAILVMKLMPLEVETQ